MTNNTTTTERIRQANRDAVLAIAARAADTATDARTAALARLGASPKRDDLERYLELDREHVRRQLLELGRNLTPLGDALRVRRRVEHLDAEELADAQRAQVAP